MTRPVWEYPALPEGLTGDAFRDAALSLRTGSHCGRVQALPSELKYRASLLFGTDYPENVRRIQAARRYDSLGDVRARLHLDPGSTLLPAILWTDPSKVTDETVPFAVVAPNGYVGSVWSDTGSILASWVASHARQGWLWAAPLEIPAKGTRARLWHPTWTSLQCASDATATSP